MLQPSVVEYMDQSFIRRGLGIDRGKRQVLDSGDHFFGSILLHLIVYNYIIAFL